MKKNKEHIVLIAGTGRAGTTFLVNLLTELKFDTGFSYPGEQMNPRMRAGMEYRLKRDQVKPYIVKNPKYSYDIERMAKQYQIDMVIIPVRYIGDAVKSRQLTGWFEANDPVSQYRFLLQLMYCLIESLAKNSIPHVLLWFPRLAKDPKYLYGRLKYLVKNIKYSDFEQAFYKISKPELIGNYGKN